MVVIPTIFNISVTLMSIGVFFGISCSTKNAQFEKLTYFNKTRKYLLPLTRNYQMLLWH
jgi:hypothetical protein